MEKKKIALMYHEKDEKDAIETFEDIQSELSNWKIPYKIINGKIKKIFTEGMDVHIFLFDGTIKKPYDTLYISEKSRKNYEGMLKEKAASIYYHDRPFQHLVDIVLEIKNAQPISEEKPTEKEIVEENVTEETAQQEHQLSFDSELIH